MEETQLLLIEAKSDVTSLKDKNSEIVTRLDEEKRNYDEVRRQVSRLKDEATQTKDAVLPRIQESGRQDELAALAKDKSVEEVDQDITTEKAKLEVIQANNPQALEEHETWGRRIATEQKKHDEQVARLEELNEKVAEIRNQWEPKVDELIERINDAFSYNFEQISCAGEVGIHKDEDFDKWAIEIKVKFR